MRAEEEQAEAAQKEEKETNAPSINALETVPDAAETEPSVADRVKGVMTNFT